MESQNHLHYQEDEDMETEGSPTGVTVESQVSGNIPENQLPPFLRPNLRRLSEKQKLIANSGRVH